ncbi:MAG: ATP-binding cassette domain-containing protein [Proteobacteria bacterium]|nr:ATP-binding cassette domain-containing protein [Pseudomonadota bacterium]MDA0928640.1 ATP-binding cassette domain-containing protein [Pseudomonadota bacterium]
MISLNNVTLMRGNQTLIEDSSLVLRGGQRTGIIGRNGAGKTSLFKALAEEIPLEQGTIDRPNGLRISTMSQETPGSSRSALDFVIDAHLEFRRLEDALKQAEADDDHDRMARLHSELEDIDAYSITNRAEQLLSGLAFDTEVFNKPVSNFSGGWRVRLNLAAALMCPSDLLMLDEPTNHLDLEATVWLEQWLQRYPGTLLIISHDRSFLDGVINHVISFEGGKLVAYTGNYSAYEKLRAERLALQQAMAVKQQKRRDEIEAFVRRFRYKESKAKQAQSRLKELNRMEEIAPAHIDSPFTFHFPALNQLPAFLMQVEDLAIGFDFPLVENIKLGIRAETRIGLLGFNGSGKSTLLKVLAGQMKPMAGTISTAKKLKIGYYAQHQVDELNQQSTPFELIQKLDPNASTQEIRNYLGGFDFNGERINEKIGIFSGGEKARLALAKVVRSKPNLLLMDEPTNHLDLEMVHALTLALQEFQGALIIVSHDRHLLGNTVDEFYSIHRGMFAEFKGDLSDYEKWLSKQETSQTAASTSPVANASNNKVDKKQQRQQAAAIREQQAPLRKKEKQLERDIDALNGELEKIEIQLSDGDLYDDSNKAELTRLLQKQGELKIALAAKEEEWMAVLEQLGE